MKVKKIKLTVIMILLFFLHIINGELFQRDIKYYPSSASNFQFTSLPTNSDDDVISDLYKCAKENNVLIYVELPRASNIASYELNIYSSSVDSIRNYFKIHFNIYDRTYKSIFSGNTNVKYYDIKSVPNLYSSPCIYILGDEQNKASFIKSFSLKYNISNINEEFNNLNNRKTTMMILFVIGLVLLLMTLYELSMKRKENVISLSLGESATAIILRNIAVDTCILLAAYFITQVILSPYTQSYHYFSLSVKYYLCILCVNALIYLKIIFYSFRKAFARNTSDVELLTVSYIVKFISTTIVVLIMFPYCIFISKAISYNKQESFFSELKDYKYITFGLNQNIQTSDFEQELNYFSVMNQLYDGLYIKHFKNSSPKIIMNITSENSSAQAIYYNKYNSEYLIRIVKELSKIDLSDKIYICVPYGSDLLLSNRRDIIESIKNEYLVCLDELYNYDCEVVEYKPQNGFISIQPYLREGSKIIKEPIVIFNNIDESIANINGTFKASFLGQFRNVIMYRMDENDFVAYMTEQGIDKNDYRFVVTSVYDTFLEQKALINRELLIVSVISIMLILLQTGIIIFIVKLEYRVKSSEYCIKKLLGYCSFEINHFIYCHTIINYLLVNLMLFIFAKSKIMPNIAIYISIQLISFIIELIVISAFGKKMNKVNMNKILKGGKL